MANCIIKRKKIKQPELFKVLNIDSKSSGATMTFSNLPLGANALILASGSNSGNGEYACYNAATMSIKSSSGVTVISSTAAVNAKFTVKTTSSTNSIVIQCVRSGRTVSAVAFCYIY